MDYDRDKVDDAILALLYLTSWDDHPGRRAWKGHDWSAMDRLHQKGYISDPKRKTKSVLMTAEGWTRAEQLFRQFFERRQEL